ncbi:alcohol dehydrogenase catalytic domain-containing protein [Candidatus Saganbacteria bacterium]|nr:alcohol dehydrogenase catalytic domain-containing protein [Candidatus Saganbacteria bacterium]
MRLARYFNNHDIRIEEAPLPRINSGEILVKVIASGICGSDVMEWYRIKKAPRVLGHEITGEIVFSKSDKFKIGDRVFVSHHVPCNQCKYCRENNQTACETLHRGNYDPGGFSEFVRAPQLNVELGTYRLPENVSFAEGTMIEPLGCVLRGQKVIGVNKQQTVLILGSGFSGLLNIKAAKLKGARVIATDIDEAKLKLAREWGADKTINAKENFDLKADRIIICTGAFAAVAQAFKAVDRKGIILFFAIPDRNIELPMENFWRNEITMTASYGAAPADLEESLALISNGKIAVKKLITHTLPLADIQKGFALILAGETAIKVVIEPQSTAVKRALSL